MWKVWHRPEGAQEWSVVACGEEDEVRVRSNGMRLPGEVMLLPAESDPNHPALVEPEHGPHAYRQHMGRTEAMAILRGRGYSSR